MDEPPEDIHKGTQGQQQSPRPYPQQRFVFQTSLCGMFQSSRASKTDACALAFCGIWLWERNRFLLTREQPKPWRKRPMEICMLLLFCTILLVWALDPSDGIVLSVLVILLVSGFLWRLFEFQYTRTVFRQQLAIEEFRRREQETKHLMVGRDLPSVVVDPQSNPGLMQFLSKHKREIYYDGVHAICGCASAQKNPLRDDGSGYTEGNGGDFCWGLWSLLANMCCGWLCNCYCQLCGICGIAQEHRYLTHVLPQRDHDLWQRDYLTMQPWNEYYPAILRLRLSGQMRFLPHLQALSILSHRLVIGAVLFLTLATLIVALPVHFPRWQILVLYGTLLQPMMILYFVYWSWNRLDISLDAVIKFFASGFFICTGISIVYEMLASIFASVLEYLISLVAALGMILSGSIDVDVVLLDVDDDKAVPSKDVPIAYLILMAVLTAFLNAFAVAALVEELGKYLTFWMTSEHPDLEPDNLFLSSVLSQERAASKQDKGHALGDVAGETTPLRVQSHNNQGEVSQSVLAPVPLPETLGAAVTIAMITTALGFACAENLLYVFVYSPPGFNEEITTLVVRCLFPIHPLAAAIQSLGVCRRDLERDPKIGVGWILFPAWLLHGSFDFFLMAYSLIARILEAESDNEGNGATSSDRGAASDDASTFVVPCVMIIPLVGVVYYFREAWHQRERLEKLDRQQHHDNI